MSDNQLMSGAAPIHVDLASLDHQERWVLWESIERNGHITKVPVRPDGERASATDRRDWFARAACEASLQHLAASGIGLVLGPLDDGTCLAGIDLDNCRHNDSLTPWAQKIIERLGTYTEISPSGSGVKLFFLLTQADAASVRSHLGNRAGRKWSAGSQANHPPAIELYLNGRYFTFTGQSIGAANLRVVPVADIVWLTAAAVRQFPPKSPEQRLADNSRSAQALRVAMAMRAKHHTVQEYEDALACHPVLSAWLAEKGLTNDKRELNRAWARAATYLQPKAMGVFGDLSRFRIDNMTRGEPPELRFLLQGLMPMGTLGVLFGPGGVGKSLVALDLCLEVANTIPANDNTIPRYAILDSHVPPYARGASIFLTLEDDEDEVHRRTASLDPDRARRNGPCYVITASSLENFDAALVDTPKGMAALTELAQRELPKLLEEIAAATALPVRLLVLDPAGDFINGDENNAAPVKLLMRRLRTLANQYDTTIILLGHVPKASNDASPTMRGSSAWIANARFAYSLRPKAANGNQRVRTSKEAATGLIEGALTKANHAGAPINQVREFRRDERGRLILAATPPDSTAEPTDEDLAAMLAAQCAAYAAAGMPFASSGKYGLWRGRADLDPPVAGLSKNRLAAICALAIDNGSLIKMPMADDQRAIFLDVQGGALSQGMAVNIPSGSRRLALRARDNADGGQEVA